MPHKNFLVIKFEVNSENELTQEQKDELVKGGFAQAEKVLENATLYDYLPEDSEVEGYEATVE